MNYKELYFSHIQNIENTIKEATQSSHSTQKIRIIAVSKKQSVQACRTVASYLQDFGENYLQEALEKQNQLKDLNITWHFIGQIQSNKTQLIANNFDWIHTIDRSKIIQRLNQHRKSIKPLNCCIQLNLDKEQQKGGALIQSLPQLAQEIENAPHLCLRG